jgi:putative endopeptidase
MKIYFPVFLAATLLFFSCNAPADTHPVVSPSDPLDIASQDSSVRPQSNFFLFADGNWLKRTVIPPSQSAWGSFSTLLDTSLFRLHRILDSLAAITDAPKGSIAQQTGGLFASAMDSDGIEKKGFLPVKAELDSVAAVSSKEGLLHEIANEYKINHKPFFAFSVTADDKNSLLYEPHFDQGGLGLPSRDYYFKTDSSSQKIRDAYLTYITRIFTLLGQTPADASAAANSILKLETAMAKVSKTPVALRDPEANYHKLIVASVPGVKKLLVAFGISADTILVGQPEYYQGLKAIINNTPLETLKNYLRFHVMNDDADYLSQDFVNAKFSFDKMLTGQSVLPQRWKRMTTLVDQQLGDNLGRIYVEQYFTAADKERITQMINNIIAAFAERIQNLDWMSDSTKQKALFKLHAIVKKVGFPEKWKDYSTVSIVRDDVIGNIRSTSNYAYNRKIAKIGKPVDRTEWQMTPSTINAYYEPTENNINFPAGILQPPFYFASGDDAVNYGGIGVVIGHEMTHGFDDQGRLYDADGNLKEWWSRDDANKFKQRAQVIVNQYGGYVSVDTVHLNGQLTEGENLADNGGLTIAYAAFKKTPQGMGNEKIDGFTPDQRFFLAHAQVWKIKQRPERLKARALTDPHSSPMWRVNGPLSNTPAFYTAFDVQPTDSMYRPDSLRVKIW